MQRGGEEYEWTNKNGESLCREKDKSVIKRLKDLAVAGHHKISASQSIFGVLYNQARAAGGRYTVHEGTRQRISMRVRAGACG